MQKERRQEPEFNLRGIQRLQGTKDEGMQVKKVALTVLPVMQHHITNFYFGTQMWLISCM